jgi:stage IV sporulation protein FB
MVTSFASLSTSATVADAADAILRTAQHEFPIADHAGHIFGIVTRDDVIRALRRHRPDAPVTEIMRRGVP